MVSLDKASDNTRSEDNAVTLNLHTDSVATENPEPKSAEVDVSSRTSSSATPTPPGAWKASFETNSDLSSRTLTDPAKPNSTNEAEYTSANSILSENTQPQTTTETDINATNSKMDISSSPPTLPLLSKITYGFGLDVVDPEPVATTTTAKLGDNSLSSPNFQQTQLPGSLQDKNSDAKAPTAAENNDKAWPNRQSSLERKHSSKSLATRELETIIANSTSVAAKMEGNDLSPTTEDTALHRRAMSANSDRNPTSFKPDNNMKPLPKEPAPSSSPTPRTIAPITPSYSEIQLSNTAPVRGPSVFAMDREDSKPPRKHEGPKWLEDMMAAKNARHTAEASNPAPPTLPPRISLPWRRSFSLQKSSTSNTLSPNKPDNSKSGKGTSWEEANLTETPRVSPASPLGNASAEQSLGDEHTNHTNLKIGQAATLADLRALDAKIPWETPTSSNTTATGKSKLKSKDAKERLKAAFGRGKEMASFVGKQMRKGEFPWTQWYCCGQVNGVECETVNSRFRGHGRCKRCGHVVCENCVKAVLGG